MPDAIRAFVAIELPPSVLRYLTGITTDLKKSVPPAALRWTALANLHLTLRFLGETAPQTLQRLQTELAACAAQNPAFELETNGVGTFPNLRQPRIVWAGLRLTNELAALQAALEKAAVGCGLEAERKAFTPHLTIARVREEATLSDLQQLNQALVNVKLPPKISFPVSEFTLMRSDLRPAGPIYTRLNQFSLGGNTARSAEK